MSGSTGAGQQRPTWVTFDCYGTLVDWAGGVKDFISDFDAFERAYQEQVQGPYRRYRDMMDEILNSLGMEFVPGALAEAHARLDPFPETREALLAIQKVAKVGILSNIDDDILIRTVEKIGITFDALITAERVVAYKPDQKIFRYALERFQIPPGDMLHCGWYQYDVVPARSCGLRTAWINRRGESFRSDADLEVADLRELAERVLALPLRDQ